MKGLPATAAPLFRAVLAAWIHAARRAGATAILAGAAGDRDALSSIAGTAWIEQRGESFGERLACSVREVFARGYSAVVITGIDAPPPRDLARVFAILARGTAVIAPARDGGVNLIGLREPEFHLLREIEVGQRDVADRFLRAFPDLVTLDVQSDIDSMLDVEPASRERDWIPFRSLLLACVSTFRAPALPGDLHTRTLSVSVSRAPPAAL